MAIVISPNAQGALTGVPADMNKAAHNNASTGGIWDKTTKSYTFAKDQHIEIGGSYVDVSGMKMQIDKDCEYGSTAINFLLKDIKPQANGIEIIPYYLKQNFAEEEKNSENARLIQGKITEIIARKRQSAIAQIGNDDETTILIPYTHTALSGGESSEHWSLLALKFTRDFTECEPYSITTFGDNAISAKGVNDGIRKAIPNGIGVGEAIDIVTMQQNSLTAGSIPTVDCGAYLIQNAENIAALGLAAATVQIDKIQKEVKQPIEGGNVNLRGIGLRAKHATILALKEDEQLKVSLSKMVGNESAATNLVAELRGRIELKSKNRKEDEELKALVSKMVGNESATTNSAAITPRITKLKPEGKVVAGVESPNLLKSNVKPQANNVKPQPEVTGGSESDCKKPLVILPEPVNAKDIKLVSEKKVPNQSFAEILETKLSKVVAADESIFFHLGKLGKSAEELKVKINEAEIVVKREENNQENKRARPIITPQIISLHRDKSQHRAEFGGVVFDETGINKVDRKNQKDGIFNDADLESANFRGCKFDNVDFSSIDPKVLSTISFVNCEFENCNFPKDFKFQQYQFKFKPTANFDLEKLTSELGNKKIPKGIPADKFEDEPSPKPERALAENLKLPSMARE